MYKLFLKGFDLMSGAVTPRANRRTNIVQIIDPAAHNEQTKCKLRLHFAVSAQQQLGSEAGMGAEGLGAAAEAAGSGWRGRIGRRRVMMWRRRCEELQHDIRSRCRRRRGHHAAVAAAMGTAVAAAPLPPRGRCRPGGVGLARPTTSDANRCDSLNETKRCRS
jgi:hypothetical protein